VLDLLLMNSMSVSQPCLLAQSLMINLFNAPSCSPTSQTNYQPQSSPRRHVHPKPYPPSVNGGTTSSSRIRTDI